MIILINGIIGCILFVIFKTKTVHPVFIALIVCTWALTVGLLLGKSHMPAALLFFSLPVLFTTAATK